MVMRVQNVEMQFCILRDGKLRRDGCIIAVKLWREIMEEDFQNEYI